MSKDPTGFCLVILALVALFLFGVMCGVMISIPDEVDETKNSALVTLVNVSGFRNITVFVMNANGEGWDEIPIPISNNTTIPLEMIWYGEGGVNVHIVYDDWESNERVLRYHVKDGEYRVVVLV